jgi:transcriptional regulator with XRE-family HTH domain
MDSNAQFCGNLGAELRSRNISLRQAEQRSGWSKTGISRAINGPALPKIDLVVDLLTSLGVEPEDVQRWRKRHELLARQQAPAQLAAEVEEAKQQDERADTRTALGSWRRGSVAAACGAVVVAAALSSVLTASFVSNDSPDPTTSSSRPALTSRPQAVEIQNKVALGANDLREDVTPVYLSSRTIGSCSKHGCKIEGTEMTSGVLVVATCQTTGAELVNYNLDSPDSAKNPNIARSTLWYQVALPDGRVGYISEVYLLPRDRGVLGLETCPGMPTPAAT